MSDHQRLILKQIENCVYTLSKRHKGRSFIWNILSEIIKEDGSILDGFIYCRGCRKVLKCLANQTSNLSRHKCCVSIKEGQLLKPAKLEDKMDAIDICSTWVIEDCQPYSAISGLGFQKLAKFLIKIGANYGENVDINDLLPDPTTVSRKVQELASEKKNKIKDEVSELVKSGGASATIDMWSDNYINRNLLVVTLHYQKNSLLFDMTLGMKSMDFERSTVENILRKLESLFCDYGINNLQAIKFITDRGTNIVKALEQNTRLNCSIHLLANVLDQSFAETAELTELLEACKKNLKHFKKVNLQHMLHNSLENQFSTRWNSNFTMLKAIMDNWYYINEIFVEKEESQQLLLMNVSTLEVLVDLCNDFEIVFKKLQVTSSPSLCFVIPSINKIKSLCEPNYGDTTAVKVFKERIIDKIDRIWVNNLNIWHKTAFFLYPPASNMQPNDIIDIKDFCIAQISNYDNTTTSNVQSTKSNSVPHSPCSSPCESQSSFAEHSNESTATFSNQPQFKMDIQFFFPDLLKNTTLATIEPPREEVERYSMEVVKITENFDVIKWWKTHEKHYPRLSKFAQEVHSIPASSAAAEQAFSLAGNIITEKKNRLGPKSVDSIMFLHSYFKNFEH